ncbi:hypothetical protein BT63DRAFT_248963 [Microthyrium microscopicum]|uniref:Uncharacterized protein n=1 Tax=Microthyrium microscopicum TaxID=703497 RepID=A0A6A6UCE8_9PEZI|nr:hypothetical protein BT63DRAFT_248963 [Microthyrium microscopicum]
MFGFFGFPGMTYVPPSAPVWSQKKAQKFEDLRAETRKIRRRANERNLETTKVVDAKPKKASLIDRLGKRISSGVRKVSRKESQPKQEAKVEPEAPAARAPIFSQLTRQRIRNLGQLPETAVAHQLSPVKEAREPASPYDLVLRFAKRHRTVRAVDHSPIVAPIGRSPRKRQPLRQLRRVPNGLVNGHLVTSTAPEDPFGVPQNKQKPSLGTSYRFPRTEVATPSPGGNWEILGRTPKTPREVKSVDLLNPPPRISFVPKGKKSADLPDMPVRISLDLEKRNASRQHSREDSGTEVEQARSATQDLEDFSLIDTSDLLNERFSSAEVGSSPYQVNVASPDESETSFSAIDESQLGHLVRASEIRLQQPRSTTLVETLPEEVPSSPPAAPDMGSSDTDISFSSVGEEFLRQIREGRRRDLELSLSEATGELPSPADSRVVELAYTDVSFSPIPDEELDRLLRKPVVEAEDLEEAAVDESLLTEVEMATVPEENEPDEVVDSSQADFSFEPLTQEELRAIQQRVANFTDKELQQRIEADRAADYRTRASYILASARTAVH